MDFLKIIIEGGWVISNPSEWFDILDFLELSEDLEKNK